MKITGKDVLDASYAPQRVPAQTWDVLSEVSHARLTGIADALNASHIAPLQGELYELREKFSTLRDDQNEVIVRLKRLAKDYQRLLRLTPDIDDSANIASWQAYKEELTKRAEQLLGGE